MIKKRHTYALLLAALTVTAGCTSGKIGKTEKILPTVSVTVAARQNINESYHDIGTVHESQSLSLSFQSAGQITAVRASEGDFVRKGQILAEIDKSTLESSYAAASATLRQAQDAYDRLEKLHNSSSITEIQWMDIQSKLTSAKSMEQIAKNALKNAELKAPSSGLIASRNVEPGEVATPGIRAFLLVDIDYVNVVFPVSDAVIANVRVGDEVEMTSDIGPLTGKVTGKGVKDDIVSHTYDVKVSVKNPEHRLLPGMICRTDFSSKESESQLVIPQSAVQLDFDNSRYVWCIVDDAAVLKHITTGKAVGQGVVVTDGLSEGDRVVVKGMQKISEGTKVKSIEER